MLSSVKLGLTVESDKVGLKKTVEFSGNKIMLANRE